MAPPAILQVGGLRFLTDPTFDEPSEYPVRPGYSLVKTAGPALSADQVGRIDVVLLSHDQHADNLDRAGREFLPSSACVLTTISAAGRLGGSVQALSPWETVAMKPPSGGDLVVTAVPAQHGPDGSKGIVGEVIGFVIAGEDLPRIYVSGDNASLGIVQSIRDNLGSMDVLVLNAGAARTPLLGDANLTLSGEHAAQATRLLEERKVLVVHVDGGKHFSEGGEAVRRAFEGAGLADRLAMPELGTEVSL